MSAAQKAEVWLYGDFLNLVDLLDEDYIDPDPEGGRNNFQAASLRAARRVFGPAHGHDAPFHTTDKSHFMGERL